MAGCGRSAAWRVHAYGALRGLRLEEARVPALQHDQLLVRVTASSVNPIDVAMIGGYGRVALDSVRALEAAAGGGAGDALPLVVGRDLAGEVVRCGAGAAGGVRPGRRVWAVVPPHWPGAHQQYAVVRCQWSGPQPAGLSVLQAGGALYAALTACAALRAAGLPAHEPLSGARVLVVGAGGVGQAALQLLAAAGARVTVVCPAELREWALAAGAADTLDRHAEDYEQRLERSEPFTAVLDCAGLGGAAAAAHRWRYRRYVTLTTPLLREMDARGAVLGAAAAACALSRHMARGVRWAFFSPRAADVSFLTALAGRGALTPLVQTVFPWRAAPAAYQRMAAGHARGKLLIDLTDDSAPAHTDH